MFDHIMKKTMNQKIPEQKLIIATTRERSKTLREATKSSFGFEFDEILKRNKIVSESGLIKAIKTSKDLKLKLASINKLGELSSVMAIQPLIDVMKNEKLVKFQCIGDLGEDFTEKPKNNEESSRSEFLCQISSYAAEALGIIGNKLKLINVEDPNVVPKTIIEIPKKKRKKLSNKIRDELCNTLLEAKHAQVRWQAAESIGKMSMLDENVNEFLIAALKNDKVSTVRESSAEALGKLYAKTTLEALIEVIKSESDELVYEACMESIVKICNIVIGTPDRFQKIKIDKSIIYENLIPSLKNLIATRENWLEKSLAVWVLGYVGDFDTISYMQSIAKSENDRIVLEAIKKAINTIIELEKVQEKLKEIFGKVGKNKEFKF